MKLLWRAAKEAGRYKYLLILSACSTIALSAVNLLAPKILSRMTGLVSAGIGEAQLATIGKLTAYLIGLYLLRVLFSFLSNYLSHHAAWNLVEMMSVKVYRKMQTFSMDFFHDKQTGELMSRVLNDTATFEQLYAHIIPESITNLITLLGVTVILFSMNARLALLTCIPIPLILLSGYILVKVIRPFFRARQRAVAAFSSKLQDNISGMQEIQAFGQQTREEGAVSRYAHRYTASMLKALRASAVFHPSVQFLTSIGTILVVGVGGYLAYQQQINVEVVVGFFLYLSLFYAPMTSLSTLLENAQHAMAGAERVMEILDTPTSIADAPDARVLKEVQGEIRFQNVSFYYTPEKPVLQNISFAIRPGQFVALVGPTGVGKSTTIQLLDRFYDPTAGQITLDGIDLRKLTLESLRAQVSLVLQDTFLFNGSIADNICYAVPGATMEEIVRAAKIARIHEDILRMPEQYDTLVGERGAKLSGGQKQRIAIARAVLHDAPILIFDEATASVDVETEASIQQAVQELAGTRTIIAIAHRLSTVRRADMIHVFEDCRIVQSGTHDQLVQQDGPYRRMCDIQAEGAQIV